MVTTLIAVAFVLSVPGLAWWYWWRATYRRPEGEALEKLRTSAGMSVLTVGMFGFVTAIQVAMAVGGSDSGSWMVASVLTAALLVSLPPLVLTRRTLRPSRSGPSRDLERRLQGLRRWTLPASVGAAVLMAVPMIIWQEVSVVGLLVGPVMLGVLMFIVLTAMRVVVERSVRPDRPPADA